MCVVGKLVKTIIRSEADYLRTEYRKEQGIRRLYEQNRSTSPDGRNSCPGVDRDIRNTESSRYDR